MAGQRLGLRKVAPIDNATNTTLDIIAIHGLGTESPRTWEFRRRDGNGVVNWLADADMLPAAIPEASIYTYDWNANYFEDAPVQKLLGHADTLLGLLANRGCAGRPLIFVASCFGGLVLAEAMNRAGQEGSQYRDILRFTVGIVFLATPFRGSDASRQAQWQVVVGGIMGEQTSNGLIEALSRSDSELQKLTQSFAELARQGSINLPLCCFYETKKTEMLRRLVSPNLATRLSAALRNKTYKLLVTEHSACLDTFERHGLDATHSGMNKFDGPGSANFILVKNAIKRLAVDAPSVLGQRQTQKAEAHFFVPYANNDDFVGRLGILEKLRTQLGHGQPWGSGKSQTRVSLYGLGGVGKTQIALAYVYWLQETRPDVSVFWVHASNAKRFQESYTSIAQEFQITGYDDPETDVLSLVKRWLERKERGRWLMVIDNADDTQLVSGPEGFGRHIPECVHGSVLVTTSNKEAGSRLTQSRQLIEVGKMDEIESKDLLEKRLEEGGVGPDDLSALSSRLEYLPLALVQAAAFMREKSVSVGKYLGLLDKSDQDLVGLLSEEFDTVGRDWEASRAIADTWMLSFDQIKQQDRLASELLSFMSFLDRQAIPLEYLSHYSRQQQELRGELALTKAIGVLKAFSFVTEDKNCRFDMHRLVQLVTRKWLAKEGVARHFEGQALLTVSHSYPYGKHENREVCVAYLPHVDAIGELKGTGSAEETAARASLLHNVAGIFYYQGRWKDAEKLQGQAVELRKGLLGPEHPHTLTSMANLASTYRNQGRWAEAESLEVQVMETCSRVLGPEHPSTLTSMANLASTYWHQGRWQEAENLQAKDLEICSRVLGSEHPSTLTSMANLASTYRNQGRWAEAESLEGQVIETSSRVLGPEHPSTLTNKANMAATYRNQGRWAEAASLELHTMEARMRILGTEHPSTLMSMTNLASTYRIQGRWAEAESLQVQVIEISSRVLGSEHPTTLTSIAGLASTYCNQGRWAEAEGLQAKELETCSRVLGSEHPSTLTSMHNLAITWKDLGRLEEATVLMQRCVQLRQQVLGLAHPHAVSSLSTLRKWEEAAVTTTAT